MRRIRWMILIVLFVTLQGCGGRSGKLDIAFDVSSNGFMVFTGAGRGGGDLYLLDLKTNKVKALTATDQQEYTPAFSHDAKRIVYAASTRYDAPGHIYMRDLGNGRTRQLTNDPKANDWSPRFSPDGSSVVFTRARLLRDYSMGGKVWNEWDVYVIDLQSGNLRQLTNERYYQVRRPDFSYDGKRVVFTAGGSDFSVMSVANTAGIQQPKKLVEGSGSGCSKRDGSTAFISDKTQPYDYEVWKTDSSGANPVQLTNLHSYTGQPVFSKDGRYVYFISDEKRNGRYELWRVECSGGNASRVADYSLFRNPLRWKP